MKETPKLETKLKHVDIHQHWLRQQALQGTLKIDWISTQEMPADSLTKALPRQKFEKWVKQLNLVDIRPLLDKIGAK